MRRYIDVVWEFVAPSLPPEDIDTSELVLLLSHIYGHPAQKVAELIRSGQRELTLEGAVQSSGHEIGIAAECLGLPRHWVTRQVRRELGLEP